jgi:hypothetical protein
MWRVVAAIFDRERLITGSRALKTTGMGPGDSVGRGEVRRIQA